MRFLCSFLELLFVISVSVCSFSSTTSMVIDKLNTIVHNGKNPSAVVFFLHGFGDTAHGWASTFRRVAKDMPHVKFVLPTAALRPVTIMNGREVPAWLDVAAVGGSAGQAAPDGAGAPDDAAAAAREAQAQGVGERPLRGPVLPRARRQQGHGQAAQARVPEEDGAHERQRRGAVLGRRHHHQRLPGQAGLVLEVVAPPLLHPAARPPRALLLHVGGGAGQARGGRHRREHARRALAQGGLPGQVHHRGRGPQAHAGRRAGQGRHGRLDLVHQRLHHAAPALQARTSESSPRLDDVSMDRASFSRMESPHIASGMNAMKRFSTDTTVIQQAANDSRSVREHEEKQKQQEQQDRFLRNSRLTSVVSAPLDGAKSKPRLVRSVSAGSILTQTSAISGAGRAYDDNGIAMMMHSPSHSATNLHTAQGKSSSPRAPSLSLPGFKPRPSVELAVSVGCKEVQDVPQMLVVLFDIRQGQRPEEISRTEMRSSLSLRSCGGDYYARDFNALLSVPRAARSMLQFEVYSVVNPSSEALENQKSLGFVRVSALDVLFSRESSMLLECHQKDSAKQQLYYLILDRFVPPNHSINVSHAYTYAKHHFLVDTQEMEKRKSGDLASSAISLRGGLSYSEMLRGQDSSTPSHILVSEELSASYVSVSMTVAFLKYLQRRNVTRIDEAKQVIHDMKQHIQANTGSNSSSTRVQEVEDRMRDVELEMAHYMRLHASYQDNLKRYETMLASLEDGREQGITGCLKRSNMKKDKATAFMATNLNCHLVRGRRVHLADNAERSELARRGSLTSTSLDDDSTSEESDSETSPAFEYVYSVVTHGCAAAHIMGFKEGGLRRLQQQLVSQSPPDPRLRERIEMREDVVRSQVLAIAGASFLNAVGLAATRGGQHRQRLQLSCSTGFLLSIESLLSTVGAEKGMLEDMSEGVRWLNSVVSFQLVQSGEANPRMEMSKCVSVTSTPTGDHVVVAFAVPPDVFAKLPEVLQQGHAIKLHGVMFTQGINEMQSVANHYLNSSLQDELNFESVQMLQRYFRVYQTQVMAGAMDDKKRGADLAELAELQSEIEALTGRLNIRTENVQKKFVNILITSSDICRRLGAGRTTCCKSGKDRTAMSVTLETSRLLVDHFHVKQGVHLCNAMRERGVRRVNVLANTGKTKFAFNSFQLKYIPDCYKPPLACADSHVAS
ncbi:hypothetical protein ON010_g3613 [Phytophthora cinnamomi]|nr:hypothetical protein ON010_g3613 [Phytophthora cinnamomi]